MLPIVEGSVLQLVTADAQLPEAPYYVTTQDLASRWARTTVLVFPCETYQQARIVWSNAVARRDQRRARLLGEPPHLELETCLYLLLTREQAPLWYTPGAFVPRARAGGDNGAVRVLAAMSM